MRISNRQIQFLPLPNSDIGADHARYRTVYADTFDGVATAARYADLAERYHADASYEPGTVVVFGGDCEITISTEYADTRVAGVISTRPAFMLNSAAGSDETHPYLALKGRVPCWVVGRVRKGDMLVSSDVAGHAAASGNVSVGTVIGKALEDHDSEGVGVIEIAV